MKLIASTPVPSATASHPSLLWGSLSLPVLLAALATSIGNVGLPALAVAFAAPFAQVQWVVIGYLLALTTLVVAAGKLGDMAGRRRLLLIGLALFSTGALLSGVAPTLGFLVAARVVQGLGAAVMMALGMAIAMSAAPRAQTGTVLGLLGTMSAIGTAIGPAAGGFLISAFGWRASFLVNVPLGVAAFLLARRYLPAEVSPLTRNWRRFDFRGAGLLVVALGTYSLAATPLLAGAGFTSRAALLAVALAATALLVLVEATAEQPLVSPRMFRDRNFGLSLAANAIVSAVLMSTLVVGPFYLSRGLALEPAAVGLALAVGPVVAALAGFPAGRLVDRIGAENMSGTGLAAIVLGCLALATMPAAAGLAGYLAAIVTITGGYAVFQSANNTAALTRVCPQERGVASGLLNLFRNLGLITGASVMGTVFARATGAEEITAASPEAIWQAMRVTFAAAGGLVLGGLGIIVAGRVFFARGAHKNEKMHRGCDDDTLPASRPSA